MSKFTKALVVGIGGILLLSGVSYLLELFGIPFNAWFSFGIGLILLCIYFWTKARPCLYISYFFLLCGLVNILHAMGLILLIYTPFAYLLAIAVALLLMYFSIKNRGLLYAAFLIVLSDTCFFLLSMPLQHNQFVGFFLMMLGLVLVLLTLLDYRHVEYVPLLIAVFVYLIASANLLYHAGTISMQILRIAEAASLTACGAVLVLYVLFSSKKNRRGE